jgi:LysR family transcriptional regulator, hydrogen peroxide-inducible genes activator
LKSTQLSFELLDGARQRRLRDVALFRRARSYFRRINCEYRDYLAERLRKQGLATRVGFQSEREDWIQMMVAAGFGVCFLPEFSPTVPGVRTQPVSKPEVVRTVSLVSMAGRRYSPAVLAFIRAIRAHDWSHDPNG